MTTFGAFKTDDAMPAGGPGGDPPSGTGWRHVTSGVEDAAATTPTAAEVGALSDAPSDGQQYARKNGAWVVVVSVAAIAIGGYYFNLTGTDPATELGYGTWALISTASILIP